MNRDEYIESLIPQDPILEKVLETIAEANLPPISVHQNLGRLLTILTAATGVSRALEIGTFGGYSAICIARGLPEGGLLTCLELKVEHAELARKNFVQAGVADKVEIIVGEANTSLDRLVSEDARFDLVFIDADKPNYPHYLDRSVSLTRPGALIIADNVLLRDRVLDEQNENPSPTAVRTFNRALFDRPELFSTLLPVHDGFAIARVGL